MSTTMVEDKSDNTAGLLQINNLSYQLKPDLSMCVSRAATTQFFAMQEYSPGSSMICIFNTGSSFVYGPKTYLSLDIKNPGSSSWTWGNGSACNLIQRVTITSRSGSILERIEESNLLSFIKMYVMSPGDLTSTAQRMGKGLTVGADSVARVVIPMSLLSGLFSCEFLLPSALCSGLRIQLDLSPSLGSIVSPTPGSYTIVGCSIVTDTYLLTDSIMRSLNEQTATSGLEIVYKTWFNTQGTRQQSFLNAESRKAVSRALTAIYRERNPSVGFTDDLFTLPLQDMSPTSVQFRVGNLYFPLAPIQGAGGLTSFELANQFSQVFPDGYVDQTSYNNISACFGTSLERDTTLDLSGIPLSNSRTLAIQLQCADSSLKNYSFYLQHVALCRVFLNNVSVEV